MCIFEKSVLQLLYGDYSMFYQVRWQNTVLERAFVPNGIPFVLDVPTIIFCADVTHPTT